MITATVHEAGASAVRLLLRGQAQLPGCELVILFQRACKPDPASKHLLGSAGFQLASPPPMRWNYQVGLSAASCAD